jgi:hypothetical protein
MAYRLGRLIGEFLMHWTTIFAGMFLALAISAHARTARCPCDVVDGSKSRVDGGTLMFGGIFLWLLGVPFSIIVLLWLFGVLG